MRVLRLRIAMRDASLRMTVFFVWVVATASATAKAKANTGILSGAQNDASRWVVLG